jgi:hypothetical protein
MGLAISDPRKPLRNASIQNLQGNNNGRIGGA